MTENPAAAGRPRKHISVLQWAFIGVITCTLTLIAVRQFNAARPQLDIKNTGSTPVTVVHGGDTLVIKPGQTWHFRYWPGERVTMHAGDSVSAPASTLTLESRGIESGMLSTVPVEVRVEETTKNVVLRYTGEVSP